MATVPYAFAPSPVAPFQFQPNLDGASYTCLVTWNVYGQRYYLAIYTLQGVRILTVALAPSPLGYDLSLTANYFTTKIVWRQVSGQIEVIS